MTTLALSHDTDPEAAEAAVRHALAAHPGRTLTVRLNGFTAADWRVIAGRLPDRFKAHALSPNIRVIYVPTRHEPLDVSLLSGRFDAAGQAVARAWHAERKAGADIILGTEAAHRHDSTLAGSGHRYELVHGAGTKGENAVEFNRERFHEVARKFIKVWGGGGPGRFARPAYALAVILQDRETGHRLLVLQNHDPAHLFPGSRFYSPANVGRWLTVMRAQAQAVRQLRKAYGTDAEIVAGDFNAGGPWLARHMARLFPGFKPGNRYEFGQAWVRGLTPMHAHKVDVGRASDHAGVRVRFGL